MPTGEVATINLATDRLDERDEDHVQGSLWVAACRVRLPAIVDATAGPGPLRGANLSY
jgi:hypothetical protein